MQILTYSYVISIDDEPPVFIFTDPSNALALIFDPSRSSFLDILPLPNISPIDTTPITIADAHIFARRIPLPHIRETARALIDSLAGPTPIEQAHSNTIDALLDRIEAPSWPDTTGAFDGGDGPDA